MDLASAHSSFGELEDLRGVMAALDKAIKVLVPASDHALSLGCRAHPSVPRAFVSRWPEVLSIHS